MSRDIITITGNLTADPELRFTASGVAVAGFTVASSTRVLDKDTNEWKDGETLFLNVSAWRGLGENIAATAKKGTSVIVTGKLKTNSYEKDGEKRTVIELVAEDFGVSLKRATAVVSKVAGGDKPAASAPVASAPAAVAATSVEEEDAPF